MKTTNEMIFATLKTKTDKPAKYADALRELGYDVKTTYKTVYGGTLYESDYWTVNDLHVLKWEGQKAMIALRCQHIEKFENIKKVDFVNYLATLEARKLKSEKMAAHGSIEQNGSWHVSKTKRWLDDEGKLHNWRGECSNPCSAKRVIVRSRYHRIVDTNHTIEEYKSLKRKSEARGMSWGRETEMDSEIAWAKSRVESAKNRVAELRRKLELAEQEVKACEDDLEREIHRKEAGKRELNDWLVAKGIR